LTTKNVNKEELNSNETCPKFAGVTGAWAAGSEPLIFKITGNPDGNYT
jgi:hypothetical protein